MTKILKISAASTCTFGDCLRRFRRGKGFGIRQLARIVDISPGMISMLEGGTATCTFETATRLAIALDLTAEQQTEFLGAVPSKAVNPVWAAVLQELLRHKVSTAEVDHIIPKGIESRPIGDIVLRLKDSRSLVIDVKCDIPQNVMQGFMR